MNKSDRRALKALKGSTRAAYDLLDKHETIGIVGIAALCAALATTTIELIVFSCLGSVKGKEELHLDLAATYFFRSRKFRELIELVTRLQEIKSVRVTAVLPDLEPRRTWGWTTSYDDLTTACQLMIEDYPLTLPDNWRVVCWSELETDTIVYADALNWAHEPAQHIHVHKEASYLRRFPDIVFADGLEHAARHQVAAYAHEGKTLEHVLQHAILVQSEHPPERKDRMYQPLRSRTLPIIHPFMTT